MAIKYFRKEIYRCLKTIRKRQRIVRDGCISRFEISLIAFPLFLQSDRLSPPSYSPPSRRNTRWNILPRTSLTWSFPEDWTRINPHSRTAHFQLARLIVDDDDTSRPSGFTFHTWEILASSWDSYLLPISGELDHAFVSST